MNRMYAPSRPRVAPPARRLPRSHDEHRAVAGRGRQHQVHPDEREHRHLVRDRQLRVDHRQADDLLGELSEVRRGARRVSDRSPEPSHRGDRHDGRHRCARLRARLPVTRPRRQRVVSDRPTRRRLSAADRQLHQRHQERGWIANGQLFRHARCRAVVHRATRLEWLRLRSAARSDEALARWLASGERRLHPRRRISRGDHPDRRG